MARRNGIAITTLLVIGGVAAILFGLIGVFLTGGGFINSLFASLRENFLLIIGFMLFAGGAVVFVRNSDAENPQWKKDIGGVIALILIPAAFILFAPLVTGGVSGAEADLTITLHNQVGGPTVVKSAEVDNFEQTGLLSSVLPEQSFSLVFSVFDTASGDYTIRCDGTIRDTGSYSKSSILEGTDARVDKRVSNLPTGTSCVAEVNVDGSNSISKSFFVPRNP